MTTTKTAVYMCVSGPFAGKKLAQDEYGNTWLSVPWPKLEPIAADRQEDMGFTCTQETYSYYLTTLGYSSALGGGELRVWAPASWDRDRVLRHLVDNYMGFNGNWVDDDKPEELPIAEPEVVPEAPKSEDDDIPS